MACKGFWECLLKLLNFLLMLVGLAMIGYGIYLFVAYKNASSSGGDAALPPSSQEFVQLGRPMLLAVSLSDNIFDKLPKAWYGDISPTLFCQCVCNVIIIFFLVSDSSLLLHCGLS